MTTTNRILVTAAGMVALTLPILTAGPAAATIYTLDDSGCELYSATSCVIGAVTTGADQANPVTVTVNGTTIGTATPTPEVGLPGYSQAGIQWTPPAPGIYWITVTQGASTQTGRLAACPFPSNLGLGDPMPTACTLGQGSVSSPSVGESLLSTLLFPISAGH